MNSLYYTIDYRCKKTVYHWHSRNDLIKPTMETTAAQFTKYLTIYRQIILRLSFYDSGLRRLLDIVS